jgi:hypothetical protein
MSEHPILQAARALPAADYPGIAQQVDALDALCAELESMPPDPATARPLLAEAHGIASNLYHNASGHPNGGRPDIWYTQIHARLCVVATRHGLPSNALGWTLS